MRRKSVYPDEIKNILKKVIGKIEKQGPGKKEKILNAWQKAAGRDALWHSRPISLRRGVLTIEVDSSTWFYKLNLEKVQILGGLKKDLRKYKVTGLRFRMGDKG